MGGLAAQEGEGEDLQHAHVHRVVAAQAALLPEGVRVARHDAADHNLPAKLKRDGKLVPLLRAALLGG